MSPDETSGRPLDSGSRRFFEQRFGVDFAPVRIHADAEASAMARAHDARAFTIGNRIAVDAAELSGAGGRQLLAHELAHVAQQTVRGPASRASSTAALESDANQAARTAIAGAGRAQVKLAAPVAVAFDRPSSTAIISRSETDELVRSEVTRLRPKIPSRYNIWAMYFFDSGFYGSGDLYDFRGVVMRGWEVNYYFTAMAMADQGYSWDETKEKIWNWNMAQKLPYVPGDPTMTMQMWFAAREGYRDERQRLPRSPDQPQQPGGR